MGELCDPRGPWTEDLIEAMIPAAIATETQRTRDMHNAVRFGAASIFKGDIGEKFDKGLQRLIDRALEINATDDERDKQAVDKLKGLFGPAAKQRQGRKPPKAGEGATRGS